MRTVKSLSDAHRPPNFVWVVLDHVTYRHYRLTRGARPVLRTHERLASQGMDFRECRSVHPLCMPARAAMLTGVYAHKNGIDRNMGETDCVFPLFSHYLQPLRYRLGYVGKNHSGITRLDRHGFDGFFPPGYGNPYHTSKYRDYLTRHDLPNPVYRQEWGVVHPYANGSYDLTTSDNFNTYTAGYIETPGPVHEASFVVSTAMDWLDRNAGSDTPFALRVDTWGPHHAFQVPLEWKDTIPAGDIEPYPGFDDDLSQRPDFVRAFRDRLHRAHGCGDWATWQHILQRAYEHYSFIDHEIGRLVNHIDQYGLSDSTYIIYTADHGDTLGSHGGMVDKAGDLMEELMHVPLVIRGPGIEPGSANNALVSNLDLPATILELAGIPPPEHMDARSLAGFLLDQPSPEREVFMAEHYGHFDVHEMQRALYHGPWKYIASAHYPSALYHLGNDPFELSNLAGRPDHRNMVEEMAHRLRAECARTGDHAFLKAAGK